MPEKTSAEVIKELLDPAINDVKAATASVKTFETKATALEAKNAELEKELKTSASKTADLEKKLADFSAKINSINVKVDVPSPTGAFKSTTLMMECGRQFRKVIAATCGDSTIKSRFIKTDMGEDTSTHGAELLHPEFDTELYRLTQEYGQFKLLNVRPMGRKEMLLPVETAFPTAGFYSEGSDLTTSGGGAGTYTQKTITARMVAAILKASRQIIDDAEIVSPSIVENIMLDLSRGCAKAIDTAVFVGDGVDDYTNGAIYGLFNAASHYASTAAATHTTFASITYNDISNCRNNVNPQVRMNQGTCWFCHPNAITDLQNIKDTNGRPILHEYLTPPFPNREGFGSRFNMLGYPVYFVHQAPYSDGASAKFLVFGDPRYFVVGMRENFSVESSAYPFWTTHQIGYKGWSRVAASVAAPVAQYTAAFTCLYTAAS